MDFSFLEIGFSATALSPISNKLHAGKPHISFPKYLQQFQCLLITAGLLNWTHSLRLQEKAKTSVCKWRKTSHSSSVCQTPDLPKFGSADAPWLTQRKHMITGGENKQGWLVLQNRNRHHKIILLTQRFWSPEHRNASQNKAIITHWSSSLVLGLD